MCQMQSEALIKYQGFFTRAIEIKPKVPDSLVFVPENSLIGVGSLNPGLSYNWAALGQYLEIGSSSSSPWGSRAKDVALPLLGNSESFTHPDSVSFSEEPSTPSDTFSLKTIEDVREFLGRHSERFDKNIASFQRTFRECERKSLRHHIVSTCVLLCQACLVSGQLRAQNPSVYSEALLPPLLEVCLKYFFLTIKVVQATVENLKITEKYKN